MSMKDMVISELSVPPTSRNKKKSLVVTCSDEDNSEGEVENEYTKNATALTGIYMYDDESGDEELTYDELATSYKELYTKSEDMCKLIEKQKKTISQLLTESNQHLTKMFELSNEVTQLNSQLEHLKKHVKMMNTGTDVLEEILEGQIKGKPNGI